MNHLKRSYKYNNESFVKYNFIQKPGKNGKEVLMLFQAKLFKGVLPEPGEGTQLPSKSEVGCTSGPSRAPHPHPGLRGQPLPQAPHNSLGLECSQFRVLSRRADKNLGQAALRPGRAAENSLGQARCCFWQTLPSLGALTAFQAQGGFSIAAERALLAPAPALRPSCWGAGAGAGRGGACAKLCPGE